MSAKYPGGFVTKTPPSSNLGGNIVSGVYTLDQLNQLNIDQGLQVQRSLRFRSSASAYLSRTPGAAGSQTTWTWSGWIKRGDITTAVQMIFGAYSTSAGAICVYFANQMLQLGNNAGTIGIQTNAIYRDPSAWYHIVVVLNTTSATSSNRLMIYVNGVQASVQNVTYPAQNATYDVNASGVPHNMFRQASTGSYLCDGYLSEVNFIDGLALDPSYFGEYSPDTGVWRPKKYTYGNYGTNGFYLDFSDPTSTTTLGYDRSGKGNNWTTNNISVTAGSTYDSMLDVPSNWSGSNPLYARGNYAVLNPLATSTSGNSTNSNGNLTATGPGTAAYRNIESTMQVTSGKWYWEVTVTSLVTDAGIGVGTTNVASFREYLYNGNKSNGVSSVAYGASYTTGDVIGVALDMDGNSLTFYKNGASQGVAYTDVVSLGSVQAVGYIYNTGVQNYNFGQRPFTYTPPTGYLPLCTQNLPVPSMQKGNQFFDITTYTGTGSSQNIVNSGGFQPDLVWVKNRSNGAGYSNALFDSLRGQTRRLGTNLTEIENGSGSFGQVSSFNTNGFSVATGTTSFGETGASGDSYVAWQWKAGNTSVVNTSGTITSQVNANPSAGFSIVTYMGNGTAGATIGHGLGLVPSFMFFKLRTGTVANNWQIYHSALGNTSALYFTTNASMSTIDFWNNTSPTSSVVSLGSTNNVNASGQSYVGYCWSAIPGFSAFGSYTGNGSTDGPFIHLGFRPRWVLIKNTTSAYSWMLYDTSRNSYNVTDLYLNPNTASNEGSGITYPAAIDVLSNGFKTRNYDATYGPNINASGSTYIYAAFAENPFKYSLAR